MALSPTLPQPTEQPVCQKGDTEFDSPLPGAGSGRTQFHFYHGSPSGKENGRKILGKTTLILGRSLEIPPTCLLSREQRAQGHSHIPYCANDQPSASASSTRNSLSSALSPLLADCRSHAAVTAGKFHFFAASYLEPPGSLTTRWVLANIPFFALAFRTKNSWTLKLD